MNLILLFLYFSGMRKQIMCVIEDIIVLRPVR